MAKSPIVYLTMYSLVAFCDAERGRASQNFVNMLPIEEINQTKHGNQTNLSAKKTQTGESTRFSDSHEHVRRATNPETAQSKGP